METISALGNKVLSERRRKKKIENREEWTANNEYWHYFFPLLFSSFIRSVLPLVAMKTYLAILSGCSKTIHAITLGEHLVNCVGICDIIRIYACRYVWRNKSFYSRRMKVKKKYDQIPMVKQITDKFSSLFASSFSLLPSLSFSCHHSKWSS